MNDDEWIVAEDELYKNWIHIVSKLHKQRVQQRQRDALSEYNCNKTKLNLLTALLEENSNETSSKSSKYSIQRTYMLRNRRSIRTIM